MFARLKETGQHTLIFGIGQIFRQSANYLLLPIYTYYLIPAEFGVLNLLLIAGMLVSMIPSAIVGPALFRSYYDYETVKERSMVVNTALILSILMASTLFFLGLYFSQHLSFLLTGENRYAKHIIVIMINSAVSSVNTVTLAIFRAQKWSLKYIIVSLSALFISLTITIYLVVVQRLNIFGVVIGTLVGSLVLTFLSLWMIRHHLQPVFSVVEAKKMVSYGTPFIPTSLINFFQNSFDRLIIQALFGPAAVGLYALAKRFGQIIFISILAPFRLISPAIIMSAEHDHRAKEFYAHLLTYLLLVTTFMGLGISILVEDILKIIANPQYWSTSAIVPWICLSVVFHGIRGLLSVGITLKRKTFWFPVFAFFDLLIYLGLVYLLIPYFGLMGVGIALAVSRLLTDFLCFWTGRRYYPYHLEYYRIIKIFAVTLVVFIVGGLIDGLNYPVLVSLMYKIIVTIVGYWILLTFLRFWEPAEVKKVQELLGHKKQQVMSFIR